MTIYLIIFEFIIIIVMVVVVVAIYFQINNLPHPRVLHGVRWARVENRRDKWVPLDLIDLCNCDVAR
jgi:hypothetical protein